MSHRDAQRCGESERTDGVARGPEDVRRERDPGLARPRRRAPAGFGLALGVALSLGLSAAEDEADLLFVAAGEYETGGEPSAITVGCFDGDAFHDFAVANTESDTVSVFLGRGDGTFEPGIDSPAGITPYRLCAGHFDGDGNLDLVVVGMDFGCARRCTSGRSSEAPGPRVELAARAAIDS